MYCILWRHSLAGLTHFHKRREGSGELCIQAVSRDTVQCNCSILSHDALRHCLSSNSSLENGERELGHLSRYCRSCKNTSTILLGSVLTSQQVILKTPLFEIWLHHPTNCIPVGHSLYSMKSTLILRCCICCRLGAVYTRFSDESVGYR